MNNEKFELLFSLMKALKDNAENNKHGYWSDGDQILCKKEEDAETLADFLEDLGFDAVNTSYYNPVEDERDGSVDEYTGYYAVTI